MKVVIYMCVYTCMLKLHNYGTYINFHQRVDAFGKDFRIFKVNFIIYVYIQVVTRYLYKSAVDTVTPSTTPLRTCPHRYDVLNCQ